MDTPPLVTFVVPCYNYGHFLAECVNSILAQDYEHFEVLIMDNCSPDNTPEVARSFEDSRVRHIRNESNLGHVRNYNKGLELAQGKYVWVLCADDILGSRTMLRRFVDTMEQNEKLAFVFCRAQELRKDEETTLVKWADCGEQDLQWLDSVFFLRLIESCCIVLSSVMIRKKSLDQVGLFPVDLPYSDDWYIWGRLAMDFGVAYFAEPMLLCRYHEASLTTQFSKEFARVCLGDELTVLYRLAIHAQLERNGNLHNACVSALVRRAKHHLMAPLWGSAHPVSAAELEDILRNRIPDLADFERIRRAIYSALADDVMPLYSAESTPLGIAEEVSVFWDFSKQAELAGVPALRDACQRVLSHRLARRLRGEAIDGQRCLTDSEFSEIIQGVISDREAVKQVQALVYSDLAEQQYNSREYESARKSYRTVLEVQPDHPGTSAKYLLLKLGAPGIWIRQMSHRLRKSG